MNQKPPETVTLINDTHQIYQTPTGIACLMSSWVKMFTQHDDPEKNLAEAIAWAKLVRWLQEKGKWQDVHHYKKIYQEKGQFVLAIGTTLYAVLNPNQKITLIDFMEINEAQKSMLLRPQYENYDQLLQAEGWRAGIILASRAANAVQKSD